MQQAEPDATTGRITEVVGPRVAELGMDLEAVELTPAGKRRVLRVDEDPDGGGVVLDVDGEERGLAWLDVERAVVQVEFNRKGKEA